MDHGSHGQPLPHTSLSGSWVLDVERSDTLEDYLRCLLVPEDAIQCQVAGERVKPSRNTIALDRSNLFIHQSTAIHNKAENFELDEEQVIESDTGDTQLSTVSLGPSGGLDGFVRIVRSQSAQGRIVIQVEARQLSPGGSSHTQRTPVGPSLIPGTPGVATVPPGTQLQQRGPSRLQVEQELQVQDLGTGTSCVVSRFWVRLPGMPLDMAMAHA